MSNDKRRGYIPANNAEFTMWFTQLFSIVQENTTEMAEPTWNHIPTEAVQELQTAYEEWHSAYMKSLPPHGPDITAARNETRARTEAVLRPFIQRYLYWPPVTDADRLKMGLPTRDPTRTPHIEVHELVEFELALHGIREIIIKFWVKNSSNKAKPTGYDGAVVVWAALDKPPPSVEALTNHAMASRTPHPLKFPEAERGKTAYIAMAWQNARGNLGDWSEIQSAIIP